MLKQLKFKNFYFKEERIFAYSLDWFDKKSIYVVQLYSVVSLPDGVEELCTGLVLDLGFSQLLPVDLVVGAVLDVAHPIIFEFQEDLAYLGMIVLVFDLQRLVKPLVGLLYHLQRMHDVFDKWFDPPRPNLGMIRQPLEIGLRIFNKLARIRDINWIIELFLRFACDMIEWNFLGTFCDPFGMFFSPTSVSIFRSSTYFFSVSNNSFRMGFFFSVIFGMEWWVNSMSIVQKEDH